MDTKVLPITELKQVKEDGKNYLTGYANNKNKPDSYGDIPTNYNGEDVYVLDRMKSNPVCFVDHNSSASNIAGNFVKLEEDNNGLFFKLLFRNLDSIHNPKLKDAVSAYMTGFGRALSIGGSWFFGDKKNPNHLTKAIISEVSLVGVGADMDALTDAGYPKHFDKSIEFLDLPIAKRDYRIDTKMLIRTWVEDGIETVEIDTQKSLQKAFLYYDKDNPESVDSYKLQIAGIVDGEVKVIPQALFEAAATCSIKNEIPADKLDYIKHHINKYYQKMGLKTPFEKNIFRIDELPKDARILENLFKSGVRFNNKLSKKLISSIRSNFQCDAENTDERDAKGLKDLLTAINDINEEIT